MKYNFTVGCKSTQKFQESYYNALHGKIVKEECFITAIPTYRFLFCSTDVSDTNTLLASLLKKYTVNKINSFFRLTYVRKTKGKKK